MSYLKQGIEDYCKRVTHFIDFSIVDLPNAKTGHNIPPEIVKKKEGEIITKALSKSDFIVLLDENGSEFTSRKFAGWLNNLMNQGYKQLAFVSGGAYGFSEDIHKLAGYKLSLSKMTWPHQMVRLLFVEQLYRACTILKGMNYHND
ncbi:Ribosomal RNA large subunit methyltransferase H [subsurface metagenome]